MKPAHEDYGLIPGMDLVWVFVRITVVFSMVLGFGLLLQWSIS